MIIVNSKETEAVKLDDTETIYVKRFDNGLFPVCYAGARLKGILGSYDTEQEAKYVLGLFLDAYVDGVSVFRFPRQVDLPDLQLIHRSQFKTKKNRHGGS